MIELEPINRPRKCPRCKKLHITEDNWCEHCLCDFINQEPAIGTDTYGRWMNN